MPGGLKVVALISGGKDSLFSILHCQANGHDVVALANLHCSPSDSENEDIDSYMYQTVGGSVIPLYSDALGLPLYREIIQGGAVNTNNSYAPPLGNEHVHELQNGADLRCGLAHNEENKISPADESHNHLDEVESMTRLLERVKASHPDINAVCTGAILSTYQRTRVESVAIRLGLIPLSYLWQYPYLAPHRKTSLLEDMLSVGQDSRTVKVASAGLDASHLWLNVADKLTITTLLRRMARFSTDVGDVVGEGGEYETLAIDGPWPLWKKRIEVAEEERDCTGSGETFSLRIRNAHLIDKHPGKGGIASVVRIPSLLDVDFAKIQDVLQKDIFHSRVPCLEPTSFSNSGLHSRTSDLLSHMDKELDRLRAMLVTKGRAIFTMILLRDMSSFPVINQKYSQLFKGPNPPARVTIACGDALPEGVELTIHAIFTSCPIDEIKALHVQSQSYWAPANIGPYSQAVSVPTTDEASIRIVHIAGQIPLVPSSMELFVHDPEEEPLNFLKQAIISLQHLWRVGRAMNVCWWPNAVSFIAATSDEQAKERAGLVRQIWAKRYSYKNDLKTADDETDSDPSQGMTDRSLRNPWSSQTTGAITSFEELPDTRDLLPDHSKLLEGESIIPPCLVVRLCALPRKAPIEWYSTGIASFSDSETILQRPQALTGSAEAYRTDITGTKESFFCGAFFDRDSLLDIMSRFKFQDPIGNPEAQMEIYLPRRSRAELGDRLAQIESIGFSVIHCESVFFGTTDTSVFAGLRVRNGTVL